MLSKDLQCCSCNTITRVTLVKDAPSQTRCGGCGKPHGADVCSCGAWLSHEGDVPRYRYCTACGGTDIVRGVQAVDVSSLNTAITLWPILLVTSIYFHKYWPNCWLLVPEKYLNSFLKSYYSPWMQANLGNLLPLYCIVAFAIAIRFPILPSFLYGFFCGSRGQHLIRENSVSRQYLGFAVKRYPLENSIGIHIRRSLRRCLRKIVTAIKVNRSPQSTSSSDSPTDQTKTDGSQS